MKETGQLLKRVREEKNISLEEVAQATKIKLQALQAIEAGNLDALPKKAFVRGFVRTYAEFLHLNVSEVLDVFHKEVGSTSPSAQTPAQEPTAFSSDASVKIANSRRNPFLKGILALGVVVLFVLIYAVMQIIEKYERESHVVSEISKEVQPIPSSPDTTNPEDKLLDDGNTTTHEENPGAIPGPTALIVPSATPPSMTTAAAVKIIATASPSPSPTAIAKPTATPSPKPTATPTPKPTPSPTPKPTATATPKPSATPKPTSTPATKPSATPDAKATPNTSNNFRPQELIVEALDKVEVRYQLDNSSWTTVKMSPEQIVTLKANADIRLRSTDGGAVNLIYNGRDMGVPGTLGEKYETKFPK